LKSLQAVDGELRQHWYIVALAGELRGRKPLARTVYGKYYALFRDGEGKPRALLDRCVHRGAKLSEGRCVDGGLACPYHGWVYDSSGNVVDIPSEGPRSAERAGAIRARRWSAPSVPVVEQDGVLWLWAGDGEPHPASPPWKFPHADDQSWQGYFMVTDFANEVTHLVQNFMDVPHTVFVHRHWFRDRALIQVPYTLEVGAGSVTATYQQPGDAIGGVMRWVINPDRLPMVHTDQYVFPNLTRVDYRFGENGFVINSQCTPVERYSTRVYTWIAYRGSWLAPWLRPVVRFYTRRVIQQDVEIMRNQGGNLRRFGEEEPAWKSTAADDIHLAISRLREAGVHSRAAALAPSYRRERLFWI
jgi:phenylpropionate dioxygenase-like ring-hydroxylating dioxygenase large terminal subunit